MTNGLPSPPDPVVVKTEKVKEIVKIAVEEPASPKPSEEVHNIQGEKPKIGNVVGVQKSYLGKKRSGISISAMQTQKKEEKDEKETEDLSNKPRTPFTIDELVSKWKSYSYKLKDAKKQVLYTTLSKNNPIISSGFNVEFTVDSKPQKEILEDEKPDLLTFLRSELNNYKIQLAVLLNEVDNSVKHLSSKDKFLKMAEKNEVLHELRERLNLDIEY